MSTNFLVKGWCPNALRPMASGDGLIVRIKPPGGRLSAREASEIAKLASRYGNGVIDISNRANLQVRGVREQSYDALLSGLMELDLIDANADAEANRNIIVTPFAVTDDLAHTLAEDLSHALAKPNAPRLPGKFGFAIDIEEAPVLRSAPADIRFERASDGSLVCVADGAGTGAIIAPDTAVEAAVALSRWFLDTGGMVDGRGRMAAHIARGTPLPERFTAVPRKPEAAFKPTPGQTEKGWLVGLAFGQMSAQTLAALAQLGPLQLTPWRMVLIVGLHQRPELQDVITDADDPLNRVVACVGAPSCPQAHQPTRSLARMLSAHVPNGSQLHVSGCAKGCAQPTPTPRTLVAGPTGFSLIRHGRAGDDPIGAPVSAEALIANPTRINEAV